MKGTFIPRQMKHLEIELNNTGNFCCNTFGKLLDALEETVLPTEEHRPATLLEIFDPFLFLSLFLPTVWESFPSTFPNRSLQLSESTGFISPQLTARLQSQIAVAAMHAF